MSKRDKKQQFTPTPPSSARPTSSRRSARPGRKLIRVDSTPTTPPREEFPDRNTSPNGVEQMTRQMFSNFQVLPPIMNSDCKEVDNLDGNDNEALKNTFHIHDKLMTDNAVARKTSSHEEAITSYEANTMAPRTYQEVSSSDQNQITSGILIDDIKPEVRRLYRKGDIFRDSKSTSGDMLLENRSDTVVFSCTDKMSQFKIPLEPDEKLHERIHLAFRIPDQNRLERYFLPTDRVGDVVALLQIIVSKHHDEGCALELSINDFPRRKLDQLSLTLSDANIKDRTVIDVLICEDDGIS